jgi:hypothetical protein
VVYPYIEGYTMDEKLIKDILVDVKDWEDITVRDIINAIRYLKRFGYLVKSGNASLSDFKDAVAKFQDFFGITVDGKVGPKTLTALSLPRCGCPEFLAEEANEKLIRWGRTDLTYFIASRDGDLSVDVWDAVIAQAFAQISAVCGLTFTKVTSQNKANFVLGVGRGSRDNFDGSSGTLAWYELPSSTAYQGQLFGKFDADELWTVNGRGIKLLNVATHEILHGCGLTHSSVKTALMAPFYSPDIAKPQQNDDIARLQARYGKPQNQPEPPVTPPVPPSNPDPAPRNKIIIEVEGEINIPGYILYKR